MTYGKRPYCFLLSVAKGIVSFERENRDLSDAVLVKETLDLVAACDRVLSKPGGSMLLCGKSGVGRRSAVSIVSALHQAKFINLKMGKTLCGVYWIRDHP